MNWGTTGPRGHRQTAPAETGPVTIRVRVSGGKDSASAEAAIEVRISVEATSVDQPPDAVDDDTRTPEDRSGVVDVPAKDMDPDGDRPRVETFSAAAHGTAHIAVVDGRFVLHLPGRSGPPGRAPRTRS